MKILLATTNKGKLKEFNNMAKGTGIEFEICDMPEILENGNTFFENAYIKAEAVSKLTGKITLADDSGLLVNCLGDKPGIHTARYRSDLPEYKDRCNALIEEINQLGTKDRKAKFICNLTLVYPNGKYISFEGETRGEITNEIIGENGHGYDPVFYSYDLGKSFGLATVDEKDKYSHRARAFEKLKNHLSNEINIAPSLLSADFSDLKNEVINIEKAGATHLHLDVMDGAFVPNITFGAPIIKAIRKHTNLIFDIHMMVESPERYIKDMVDAGADSITLHYESTKHLDRAVELIKSYGKLASVAINPATPVCMLDDIAHKLDMVLIMSVNPGFGGQKFINNAIKKVKELREKYPTLNIQVDGGINENTAKLVKEVGANILVAGSYVFSGDYKIRIDSLK